MAGGGQPLYIVKAISPLLESIAETARSKSPTSKDEVNQYDAIIGQIAKRVASGVQPHQDSAVKRVRLHGGVEEYAVSPIWYSYTIGPNAPRVYFMLRKIKDLVSEVECGRLGLEPEQDCLVVVGETDKANQTKVLQQFSGDTRRRLRQWGSGSV